VSKGISILWRKSAPRPIEGGFVKMQFHAAFGRRESVPEVAELAQLAERSGFTHVSLPDQPALNRDVWVELAAVATATKHIHMGAGVTDPLTYHPMIIANATASVDELSGGRAFAGIGAGGRFGKDMNPIPMQDLREAARFIKAFMAGEEAEYKGLRVHSEWIRRPVPLVMAIDGPRSHDVAGEFADTVYVQSVHPVTVKWRLELLERAATKAGRDPSTVAVLPSTNVYVADSKAQARREVSTQSASKLRFAYHLWGKSEESEDLRRRLERADPGLVDELYRVKGEVEALYSTGAINYDHEQVDAPFAKPITQRVIDYFQLAGSPTDISERLEHLHEIGVAGFLANMYTYLDRRNQIEEIGRSVISRFSAYAPS
jgi:5,10-methylenetetrahydromethanopterin reductase